jgi:CO/xanthine dehydrogenase FAD-binding subunit
MEYFSPTELPEAYAILARYGGAAVPVAGSTFFMGHRLELFDEVEAVVDIKRLGLGFIRLEPGRLRIGATTTLAELFSHPLTSRGEYRIIADTVHELKIREVRNAATVGGEVCIAGEVDMPTTLLALDADIVIGGATGTRVLPLSEFHRGYLNNALRPGEMVLEVQIPRLPPRSGGGFGKFERTAADLPIVNAAVRVTLERDGTCAAVRIAVGAATAAGIPLRVEAAERRLLGCRVDEGAIRAAAECCGEIECVNDFRASAELRSLWVRCAVENALGRAVANIGEDTAR